MKNLLIILMGLMLIYTCNSGSKGEKNNGNDEIIEIGQDDVSQNIDDKQNNESGVKEIQLDPQFKKFLDKFEKVSLPYRIEPEEQLDYEIIPTREQARYLSKAENLNEDELKEMEPFAKFYYLSKPISTNRFKGIIYARSEMGSSYYIFCTFDNQGNFISSVEFAMYQLIGAGPQAGQEYISTGSIDKNFEMKIISDQVTRHYQIKEDGKIVEKK
jgi:hypothetical protein